MTLKQFHEYVGETIMFCQCIELDIKSIYAAMAEGNFSKNLSDICDGKWTLGKAINELKNLDNSDGNPFFSIEDYELLRNITKIRNHWAHDAYTSFIYEEDFNSSTKFIKQVGRLENDHNRLEKLSDTIEQVRIDFLKKIRGLN